MVMKILGLLVLLVGICIFFMLALTKDPKDKK